MTKVLLAFDTSERANWGCRTTSRALRTMIAERATLGWVLDTMKWPVPQKMEATEAPAAPGAPRPPFGARFNFRLTSRFTDDEAAAQKAAFGRRGVALAHTVAAEVDLFREHNYGGLNDVLEEVDTIVINGEGGVMERRAPGRIAFFLLHYNARHFRRKIAMVNHTADLRDPLLKRFAALAYPHADAIRVREPASFRQVAGLEGRADLRLAADAAFRFSPVRPPSREGLIGAEHFDPGKPYICVGGSAAWRRTPLAAEDEAAFVELILQARKLCQVVLSAAGTPEDVLFAKLAAEHDMPLAPPDYPTQSAVDLLGQAAAYLGGRWHSAIKALTGGAPVVLFDSNSLNKNAGLVELLGVDGVTAPFPADGIAASKDRMLDDLRRHLDAGPGRRALILERVAELAESARLNVDILER